MHPVHNCLSKAYPENYLIHLFSRQGITTMPFLTLNETSDSHFIMQHTVPYEQHATFHNRIFNLIGKNVILFLNAMRNHPTRFL